MSRSFGTSTCIMCGNHTFDLGDLRGKPIEFRKYYDEPPVIGAGCDCPICGQKYFVQFKPAEYSLAPPAYGKWGKASLDLSFYNTFDDKDQSELVYAPFPWHLYEGNLEDENHEPN